ncbi:MAG: GTPase ObgE, partial [Oscillospiraceae bacterium]|nr:GTPase ObgE [Oscillospiraceae bacterium]
VSFHREKYVAAGGPDGGDGGNGGNIVFQVDDNFSTLIDFRYKRKYVAPNGENGSAKRCTGKSAPDLVIRVPRGTLVKEAETGRIMADMSDDVPHILARGGRGGKGNSNFATSTRQIPKFAKPGFPGESFDVTLELKLLADVGLVGFPNVGKSTLISVVSAAKPKIANYHFTTLTPVLGVVRLDEERSFVMADIPGLIEGASEGTGLGHEFLRHVERCRLILHVLDVSGSEGRNPAEDFEKINQELANFSESLAECPQIVVANKSDMATPEQIAELEKFIESKHLKFHTISAATTKGTKELMQIVSEELSKLPPVKIFEAQPLSESDWEAKLSSRQEFEIEMEDHIYYISAPWLEPILRTVNMEDYSSLQYFQRVLRSSGIIDKLEELGIQEGDTVNIFGFEFDYIR